MCKCGCNSCGVNMGPLLKENRVKHLLSKTLQYHIDKKIPIFETRYSVGSNDYLSLIVETRKMYSRNIIDLCEEDEKLIKNRLNTYLPQEHTSKKSKKNLIREIIKNKLKI